MLKRRTVLQGALAGAVVSGCSTGTPESAPTTADPAAVPVEVVAGAEYGGFAGAAYRKKYAGATVTSSVAPQLRDKVLTRFQAGSPPDVVLNAGEQPLDIGRLVAQGQVADLRAVLDAPAWDNPQAKVADGILPGMLESGQYDGTQRTINYVATVYGLWYSAAVFQRRGWDVPRTWPEFLALGTEMKGAGLGAFVYPGNHPYYVLELILTLAAKTGGHDVVKRIDNLETDAWRDSSIMRAISAVGELVKRGLIAPGSAKYDHLAAQKRFLAGKAGMLPCGNWLENEMKASIPANFALTMFGVPPLDGSPALPRGLHVAATSPYLVAEKGKNKAGGLEYLRAALSRSVAAQVTTEANQLTIVRGAADGLEVGTALRSARDLLGAAGDQTITWYFDSWYPAFATAAAATTGEFLAGGVPVSEWSGKIQSAADALTKDKAVTKYHRA
ncbi:N-acetylglucosamine/diacetylchitobiose ABC transporter substrate-binding protein [Kribbella sp. NPDC005582]|uniref:N-acetylglucosamine/diacetylchitobiose ABC transporter substrate-binding protein n=1 Tax=Kribbella sp. NPDC005582 TaxID=3156893 RepID=UPI0033A75D32